MQIINQTDKAFVTLDGRLDSSQAEKIRSELVDVVEQGKDLEIDLESIDFIDSSGLGLLVSLRKKAATAGGEVILKSLQEQPLQIFKLSRLFDSFKIV